MPAVDQDGHSFPQSASPLDGEIHQPARQLTPSDLVLAGDVRC